MNYVQQNIVTGSFIDLPQLLTTADYNDDTMERTKKLVLKAGFLLLYSALAFQLQFRQNL